MCDQIQCWHDCNGCFDEALMMACEMRVTVRVESGQRLLFDVWLISQCFPFTELETIVSSIYQKEKRMEGGQRGKDFCWNDWFFNVQNTRREDDIRWMEWGKGLLFKRLICFLSVKLTASVNRSVGNDTSCIYEKRGQIGEICCWTPTDLYLSVFKLNPHTESVQQLYATQLPFIVQRLIPKQTTVEHSPIGRLKFKCSWVKAWPKKIQILTWQIIQFTKISPPWPYLV